MAHHPYLWLTLGGLLLYGRTLSYGLVIDDLEWQARIKAGFLRQHPQLLWYSHFGLPAPIEHTITLTLHIITACLVCKVAGSSGFVSGLLFVTHPCNHQTSVWLTGRRYSYLNILVLTCWILKTWWVMIPVAVVGGIWAIKQLSMRSALSQHPGSPLETLRIVLMKLVGIGSYELKYSHIYPDSHYGNLGPAPFLPHTQPCAERYLSIPLLGICLLLSQLPLAYPLIALYTTQTLRLLPMYTSIQSFYNYHLPLVPSEKLALLTILYPELKT